MTWKRKIIPSVGIEVNSRLVKVIPGHMPKHRLVTTLTSTPKTTTWAMVGRHVQGLHLGMPL